MSDRGQPNTKRLLANELGQMSIFLALVFQVLFVFFAMVINIGLLVHDKINLQNSVDLGAYYAAQKQAEILNEIAHLNYQIRQDYKLLAWRYWVLGTIGRNGGSGVQQPPPHISVPGTDPGEVVKRYISGALPGRPPPSPQEEVPVACLANPYWWEFAGLTLNMPPNENYCWHPYNWVSTSIAAPSVPFTPATAGYNAYASYMAQMGRDNYTVSCEKASPMSWAFVAAIMTNYKYSISYKKRAIKKLTENLVSANPLDRDGTPIRQGVLMTIEKNLTESNRAGFDPNSVQVLNGHTRGGCDGGSRPGENTIAEILTAPGMYFALLGRTGASCNFTIRFQLEHGLIAGAGGNINVWDPPPQATLRNMVSGEPANANDDFHSSLGFEKNPWCMSYIGIKAQTRSRKPFAPFGQPTTLEARAFAQPFGGRIGPWYGKRWDRAAQTSVSPVPPAAAPGAGDMNPHPSQMGDRTDPLTSPRLVPGTGGYQYSAFTIPNYSRFPGDRLGLRSSRAQAAARHYFRTIITNVPAGGPGDPRLRLNWFYNFGQFPNSGDSLAFDAVAQAAAGAMPAPLQRFRRIEMAAVAPDLFDLTYYSIDPAADENYVAPSRNPPDRYGRGSQVSVGDLGSREDVANMRASDIETQIDAAMSPNVTDSGVDPTLRPVLFWLVRSWKHLLTGWAPHRVTTFTFPTDRFGKCQDGGEAIAGVMIPGKCTVGGRVGYSVRLISRDHLNGPWQIGGAGVGAQTIRNAPGDDSQF